MDMKVGLFFLFFCVHNSSIESGQSLQIEEDLKKRNGKQEKDLKDDEKEENQEKEKEEKENEKEENQVAQREGPPGDYRAGG